MSNGYMIPDWHVDFSGPSFDQGRPIPDAPGGAPRVCFPAGWQSYVETERVFPPGWDSIPHGWPAEDAPENFQTPAHITPSEEHMLPPSAAGHLGRPSPPFIPPASNLVAPGRSAPQEAGPSSGDPWRRPSEVSGRAVERSTATTEQVGTRPAWSNWAPGGALQGEAVGRGRTGARAHDSRGRAASLPAPGSLMGSDVSASRETMASYSGKTRLSDPLALRRWGRYLGLRNCQKTGMAAHPGLWLHLHTVPTWRITRPLALN